MLLGAIADDFTGATDLCSMLVRGGMRTMQLIGVPGPNDPVPEADAVVVALKSRTAPVGQAVGESLAALDWNNSRLLKGELPASVAALKQEPGKDIPVFGSAGLTADLADTLEGVKRTLRNRGIW